MAVSRRRSSAACATELESLGYGALWSSGGFEPGLSPHFEKPAGHASRVTVASGIVSIWAGAPEDIGPAVAAWRNAYPGRFLLGHRRQPRRRSSADYSRPYSKMVAYLDALDALAVPVPPERRVLAALGPRMLELAAARSAGAHPYFVPVEHTARAREILGPGPLLAPEVAVVLEADPAKARALARTLRQHLPACPTTRRTSARSVSAMSDIDGGGSDRLIDAVIPWGDAATVATRDRAHLAPGRTTSASRSSPTARTSRSPATGSWRQRCPSEPRPAALGPWDQVSAAGAASSRLPAPRRAARPASGRLARGARGRPCRTPASRRRSVRRRPRRGRDEHRVVAEAVVARAASW